MHCVIQKAWSLFSPQSHSNFCLDIISRVPLFMELRTNRKLCHFVTHLTIEYINISYVLEPFHLYFFSLADLWSWRRRKSCVQLNPAIAYFKGLVKIMLYAEVLFIANVWMTRKNLLGIIVYKLYSRNCVKSGCAIAGFHCTSQTDNNFLSSSQSSSYAWS